VLVPTGCVPLSQDTTYTFTVRARDIDGNPSPFSDPLIVTTAAANPNDITPPTQPMNITAEDDGAHVVVRWESSTDDAAPQSLIRYDVYVNDDLRAVLVGGTTAQIELDYGVSVIVTIVAVDTADNESVPGTITVIR
jgi:chitodextrinase